MVSTTGLDVAPPEFAEHVVEEQVPHSTALQARLRDGTRHLVGPLARHALNGDLLGRGRARRGGGGRPRARRAQPVPRIVVRCVEVLHAVDEALALIDAYVPPDQPHVDVPPRAGVGFGWTEAPRGLLWHRYELDDDGTVLDARIVPPTSQNQGRIEQSVRHCVELHADLPDAALQASASTPCGASTRASPARRTSCGWRSTAGDARPGRRQPLARRRRRGPRGRPAGRWRRARGRRDAAPRRLGRRGRASSSSTRRRRTRRPGRCAGSTRAPRPSPPPSCGPRPTPSGSPTRSSWHARSASSRPACASARSRAPTSRSARR